MSINVDVILPLPCCYDSRNHSRVSSASEFSKSFSRRERGTDRYSFQSAEDQSRSALVWHFCRDRRGAGSRALVFSGRRRRGDHRQEHVGLRHESERRHLRARERYVSRNRLQAMLDREFDLDWSAWATARRHHVVLRIRRHRGRRAAIGAPTSVTAGWGSSFRAAPTTNPARS